MEEQEFYSQKHKNNCRAGNFCEQVGTYTLQLRFIYEDDDGTQFFDMYIYNNGVLLMPGMRYRRKFGEYRSGINPAMNKSIREMSQRLKQKPFINETFYDTVSSMYIKWRGV